MKTTPLRIRSVNNCVRYEGVSAFFWSVLLGAMLVCASAPSSADRAMEAAGPPSIDITYQPPIGSSANLQGIVRNLNASAYKLAVLIYVPGFGWVCKPTADHRFVRWGSYGAFSVDFTSGGNDAAATVFAIFAVPNSFNKPCVFGEPYIPNSFFNRSVARRLIARTGVPPLIVNPPTSLSVTQSQSASFRVRAVSRSPLTFQWYLNGTLIPGATAATYIIDHAKPQDAGDYVVVVANRRGNATVSTTLSVASSTNVAYRVFGLNFSPYMDGQDPNLRTQISIDQLRARMAVLAPFTSWIRTFGVSDGLEFSGQVAHELGLKAAVGAWLSKDAAANEAQLNTLIAVALAGGADLLVVGSETLHRGDLTPEQLVSAIARVREEVPGLPITTADTYSALLQHPAVIDAVDFVFVNYYPYWDGIHVTNAMAALHGWHQQMVGAAKGKSVVVSETGWPSAGNTIGDAVPSLQNASFFFQNFASWTRALNVEYFYFSGFDESWKAAHEGPQGAHWGLWAKDGILKPGMERTFNGEVLPDNWTRGGIPGGPGDPIIQYTSVPAYGSFDDLRGQALHIQPTDFRVVTYIYVAGRYWIKPTFANPVSTVQPDGNFLVDVTTGGIDETATQFVSYLIPRTYNPPLVAGSATLPAELETFSIAKTVANRIP
jgi:exo-beta-1,3-glucanase (GH17 family)